jgi:hypothetical protein
MLALLCLAISAVADDAAKATAKVLTSSDLTEKVLPPRVFFRGQSADVQKRNAGGVHYADDAYVLAALVDSSGYSTAIREKYQGYLLAETPLTIGGQKLPAGAYGFGFVGGKFVVMDVGAHDVLTADATKDADMKHPVPLQIVAGASGLYRLYAGRDYVEFSRAQ